MTKAEIVNEVSLQTGISKAEVLQIVEGFMESIKTSLANGENVYLRGFGSYVLKHREEKIGRNISRNTSVVIPAHDIPFFKPSKTSFTL